MNRQPVEKPPKWWSPRLSPGWIRFWRPLRRREQLRRQRLLRIDVCGIDHLKNAIAQGNGVLITPNHSTHADAFALYEAADQMRIPFYVMVAWQVFQRSHWLKKWGLRHHGCFSVDREGMDMKAVRQAREVLESAPFPLVMFPEGEVYHTNDRVTPFREGPAAIALMAARKGTRPVVCVPCAMKYSYLDDPTPELLRLMDDLERAIYWRPRPDMKLSERIYHFAEGSLALKEIEFLGRAGDGSLRERLKVLVDFILNRMEARYGLDHESLAIPERVKSLRRELITRREKAADSSPERQQCDEDLEDIFLAVQLFSYPGDYVSQQPTVERLAETLDKFEEDVLRVPTATVRGSRRAVVTFGEPIPVRADRKDTSAVAALAQLMEQQVQALLDQKGIEPER